MRHALADHVVEGKGRALRAECLALGSGSGGLGQPRATMAAMANESAVPFTAGPPETVLPPPPAAAANALDGALEEASESRRAAVAAVARAYPDYLDAWARLAGVAHDDVEAYAYARVGYHRGLDAIRGAGWRGTGYVRWSHEPNRGFLRALEALSNAAEALGEVEEARRCATFLRQLDPDWDRRSAP